MIFSERIRIEGTYYHREVQDLIGLASVPQGACPFVPVQSANLGNAQFDGVEWAIKIKILRGLAMGANYNFLNWDTQDGKLNRRPKHRGNVFLNYQRNGFNINLAINIVGERDDKNSVTGTDIKNPGYVKMDLASSYILPWKIPGVKSLRLYGKIENLLDQDYEEAAGFPARPINFLFGIGSAFGKKEEEKSERR